LSTKTGDELERTGGNGARSVEVVGSLRICTGESVCRTGESVCFLILVRGTGTGNPLADGGEEAALYI